MGGKLGTGPNFRSRWFILPVIPFIMAKRSAVPFIGDHTPIVVRLSTFMGDPQSVKHNPNPN